jgi:hypothetical protein
MKKFSIFAIAIAAAVFAACGGNKSAKSEAETDSLKSFEQQQIEASIKMHLDSIGAEIGKLEQPKFLNEGEDGITLTKEEKQVKPDYLFAATVADNATTLPEKYRAMSALAIDKKVAKLYEMPTEDYDKAIGKLTAEINDPSFKVLENEANTYETTSALYDAMEKNGRINYFWQIAAAALVEQLYVANQNADKFLSVLNDEAAANLTFRVVLILDAINRLAQYDPDMMPVVNALAPLEVINSTTVDELKKELAEVKDKVAEARAALVK